MSGGGSRDSSFMDDVDDVDVGLLAELLLQQDTPEQHESNGAVTNGVDAEGGTSTSGDDASGESSTSVLPVSAGLVSSTIPSSRQDTPRGRLHGSKSTERKARRREQVAISARRHRFRKKHEMLAARQEVIDLTAEVIALRSKHNLQRPGDRVTKAKENAMLERYKRRCAEKVSEELRRAIVTQRQFFLSIRSHILGSPIVNTSLNMRKLLHTFTRLGKSPQTRRRDYLALCTDSKTNLAMQILLHETQGVDFSGSPSMNSIIVPGANPQEVAVTTVAAYAFGTLDLRQVFASACTGILGCGAEWPQYSAVSRRNKVLDTPQGNITYGVSESCFQSLAAQHELVSVESRSLMYYRMDGNAGVLVWDFADQDDLYPVKSDTTIKRDIVGAAMVRRELCHDGVERVVTRSICSKTLSFSLPPSTPQVANYLQRTQEGAKVCSYEVYNHIRQHAVPSTIAV